MPVVSLDLDFHAPARYDDLLTVAVRVTKPPRSRMEFEYEITNQSGTTLVTGHTTLAFLNRATRRPCRPPTDLKTFFS